MTTDRQCTTVVSRSDFARRAKRATVDCPVAAEPISFVSDARRTPLSRRLQDYALRGVEFVLRYILLSASERAVLRDASQLSVSRRSERVERASAYLGHGCLGLFDGDGPIGDPFLGRPADSPKSACETLVTGRGPLLDDLLDRIGAEGFPAHAVASDIEECLRLIQKGVTPHRLDDLPHQASRIDVIISTDFTHFIGVGVLARLPENVVILDLAGPPGSVNYELAKKFDVNVIWTPPPPGVRRKGIEPDVWKEIRTILTRQRENARVQRS